MEDSRLDDMDKRISINEYAIKQLRADLKPLLAVPTALATITAQLEHLFQGLGELRDTMKDDRAATLKTQEAIERRGQATIQTFIWPILMLLIGAVVGYLMRHLP